ncbi:MAG: efflux RND transporter periplasmic adaptor subunit [Balneolaceae bacterium]
MSTSLKRIITTVVILSVLALLAYPKVQPLFSSSSNSENTDTEFSSNRLKVEAVTIEEESVEDRILSSGSLRADEVVDLSVESSGLVTDIYFEEGSEVEEGDLLLKINDSQLQAELNRNSFRLTLAEQREERQRRLLERGGISQDEYDATLNELNVLRSDLQLIEAQIDQTELRAPFSGSIGLKYVSEGSYISPDTRIATLQSLNPIKIDFSVPERYVARVSVEDKINFFIQGVDSTFTGEVYAFEPSVDRETRSLQIRAITDNDDRMLFPGAFANITLILDTITDALMVPTISVIPDLNTQKLFVMRNGQVDEITVRTGIRTDSKVQIVEGVAPGDTVLTTGLLQVRPGDEVEITELNEGTENE